MPNPTDYRYKNIYKKSGITDLVATQNRTIREFNKPQRAGQSHLRPKVKGWNLRQAMKPAIDYGRKKKIDLTRYIKGGR